ncbi:Short chain aldehyde dehydrogenase 1 [Linum perenne]
MSPINIVTSFVKRLEGKVALITGGASGIGETTAKLFVQHGAKVVIADVQDQPGQSLADELGTQQAATYGQLDIMYNNAGISGDLNPSILHSDDDNFKRVLDVNLFGSFLGAKHAARVMVPRGKGGCILFTASAVTMTSGNITYSYKVSKHGVIGLANNLCVELGQYGIRVNAISPFAVATPLTRSAFGGMSKEETETFIESTANDIAAAALYLASDDAKYVSGMNLVVDGGHNHNHPIFPSWTFK